MLHSCATTCFLCKDIHEIDERLRTATDQRYIAELHKCRKELVLILSAAMEDLQALLNLWNNIFHKEVE